MSFSPRAITLIFTLGSGATFGDTGSNQVTVTGLRVFARILKTGDAQMSQCELRIYGLTPTVYNQLTTIYTTTQQAEKNTVVVMAGIEGQTLAQAFIGQIVLAQIDLNSQPDSIMNIVAQDGLLQAITPVDPANYPEGAPVDTMMKAIASQMNLKYENNGVVAVLSKTYIPGTARQQVLKLLQSVPGLRWNGGDGGTLAIWMEGGGRTTLLVPVVSPETGMVGYPGYSNIGLSVKSIYNPQVIYGGYVTTISSIARMSGKWHVLGLTHELESQVPDGQWFSTMQLTQPAATI